jgi:hypothetical protein
MRGQPWASTRSSTASRAATPSGHANTVSDWVRSVASRGSRSAIRRSGAKCAANCAQSVSPQALAAAYSAKFSSGVSRKMVEGYQIAASDRARGANQAAHRSKISGTFSWIRDTSKKLSDVSGTPPPPFRTALTHAETALSLFRGSSAERIGDGWRLGAILATKAWALAACDRAAESREAIDAALKSPAQRTKDPLAQIHYKSGMSLFQLSDHPGAREHFIRGAELDPAGRWGRLCVSGLQHQSV